MPSQTAPMPFAATIPTDADELEEWIRRLNDRWLVRSRLAEHANAYMNHLSAVDPLRLRQSCQIVRDLMAKADDSDDPKPRFYGGIFSLALPEEASHYLSKHVFTRLITGTETPPEDVSDATRQLILELRSEIQKARRKKRPHFQANVDARR